MPLLVRSGLENWETAVLHRLDETAVAGVGTGSPAAAEVVEAVVGTGSPAAAEDEVAVVGTGSPVSALPASTTAPSAPSFAHSSESLAALPEPLPEVALVPPPP